VVTFVEVVHEVHYLLGRDGGREGGVRREGEDGGNKYSLFRSLSPDHELQRERKSIGGILEGKAGRKGGREGGREGGEYLLVILQAPQIDSQVIRGQESLSIRIDT